MNKIALTNVRVFDGERLLEPATVVIDGDRIGSDPAGATTVEGNGRVLLPGLIDCHIHLTDDATLTALARQGVTTGLDMGTWPPELVASQRNRPGVTDVRSSGTGATHPASAHAKRMGRAEGLVADPDEARAYVSQRVADGVDYVKIIVDPPGFDEPTIRALVEAAQARACARSPTPPRVTPCCSRWQPASTCSPTRRLTGRWRRARSSARTQPGRSSYRP
jgi:cytosine/adenosine deaminase-related metal-dependent hydrolase